MTKLYNIYRYLNKELTIKTNKNKVYHPDVNWLLTYSDMKQKRRSDVLLLLLCPIEATAP